VTWVFIAREGRWWWKREDAAGRAVELCTGSHASYAALIADAVRHGYGLRAPTRHSCVGVPAVSQARPESATAMLREVAA
jgi:hypothetical protein